MKVLRSALVLASAAIGGAVVEYMLYGEESKVGSMQRRISLLLRREPPDEVVFVPSSDARDVEHWLRTHEEVFSNRRLAAAGRSRSMLKRTKTDNLTISRMKKWRLILMCWENYRSMRADKIAIQITKGVPAAVRGLLWLKLADVFPLPTELVEEYHDLHDEDTPFADIIDRDVPRTFTAHEFFATPESEGQTAMRRVLRAFSLYDESVGYCQGMNFIVALFLLYLTEEEAFCLLVALMSKYRMQQLFVDGLPRLHVLNFVFSELMRKRLPRLHTHFEQERVPLSVLTTPWFVTNFLCFLPVDSSVAIWDHFMHRGQPVVFSFALALLQACENDLLALNLEGVLLYLQELPRLYPDEKSLPDIEENSVVVVTDEQVEALEKRFLIYNRVATGSPVSHLMVDENAAKNRSHRHRRSASQVVPELRLGRLGVLGTHGRSASSSGLDSSVGVVASSSTATSPRSRAGKGGRGGGHGSSPLRGHSRRYSG